MLRLLRGRGAAYLGEKRMRRLILMVLRLANVEGKRLRLLSWPPLWVMSTCQVVDVWDLTVLCCHSLHSSS